MLFFAKEEWVADNVPLKVSREEHFDFAGSFDVRWKCIRKAFPCSEWIIGDEVGGLVDTSSLRFHVRFFIFLIVFCSAFISSFGLTALDLRFNDVIIGFCASDLAEEAYGRCLLFYRQLLERSLKQVTLLLTKADTSPVKQL